MYLYRKARKEHRKAPFLKAFTALGTISRAAKATRISRNAVHDWLRNDPSFRREFIHAKKKHKSIYLVDAETAFSLFMNAIRRIIPSDLWPKGVSEAAIALSNLKSGRHYAAPHLGNVAGVSLLFGGTACADSDNETFAYDL